MKRTETEIVAEIEELTLRRLRLWVRRGWVVPQMREEGPVFDELDAARVRLVCQLKSEMNINDDAVPVVLSLIDQLHGVRSQMRALAAAVDRQPGEIQRMIAEAMRAGGAGRR